MPFATSKDGTRIAYETVGSGEPLILVDGAMCYRDSGPMRPMAEALKDRFAVTTYDRRGRGESGNTLPFLPEREIEDLEAVLAAIGGSAYVYGCSSGGMLGLETAVRNPGIKKLIVYEIPLIVDDTRDPMTDAKLAQLDRFIAEGKRGEAVKLFMRFVGVPGFFLFIMPFMKVWKKLTGIAHTLPYDLALVAPFQRGKPLPTGRWTLSIPTLVADGGKSPTWMRNGARSLSNVVPGADYRTLAGQTHMVIAGVQAPMVADFLKS